MRDRILFERREGDGKEVTSSSLLGQVTMKRYQGLQDRDFESINCEQRAKPSSFVPYVDLVMMMSLLVLAETKNRSRAPYIP